ncbi:MAG: molybdopterin adenylyltransferase [Cytophagaceae bacterium]|nr:molybdopterin adenylyltransferase [Cytophagaceae bacterium]MDW8456508.1 molybdopterin adenylyltransferase [Cytophagaceae bacterium]
MSTKIKIGILTTSDRAYNGVYDDISGKEIINVLSEFIISPFEHIYRVVADERTEIEEILKEMCDVEGCCLVITTGGTGPALRDVTTEATEAVCEKILPGFGEAMRAESLKTIPTAILSRQTAGIRKQSLIVNLPGKPSAIRQCLNVIFPAIPYCIDLIGGPRIECDSNVIKIFRPSV